MTVPARRWVPGLVALGGVVLRTRQILAGRSLWLDEAMLANNFRKDSLSHLLTTQLDNSQSATVGVILSLESLTGLLGHGDIVYRVVPFLASIVLVVAALAVSTILSERTLTRAVFVALAAFSPALVYYSTEVKGYGIDAATMMVVLAAVGHHRRWRYGVLGLVAVGIVVPWVSLPGALVLAAAGLVLAIRWWRDGQRRRIVSVGVLWSTSALAAGVWSLLVTDDRSFFQTYWSDGFAPAPADDPLWYPERGLSLVHLALRHEGIVFAGEWAWWHHPLNYLLLIGVVAGLVAGWRAAGDDARAVVGVVLAVTGLATAAAVVRIYPFHSRPMLFLTPLVFVGLALLLDRTIEATTGRMDGARRWGLPVFLTVLVCLPLVGPTVRRAVEPYDGADAKAVLDHASATAPDASVASPLWNVHVFRFYEGRYPDLLPSRYDIPVSFRADGFLRTMARAQPGETWVIVIHDLEPSLAMLAEIADVSEPLDRFETESSAAYLFDFDSRFARALDQRSG